MTDQTLPVCRLCKCVAADYKNPGEDVKHHCANDHCTLHMVLMTPEQWTALMGVAGPIDPIASIEAVGMVDIVNTGRGKHAIYTNLDPAFDLPAGRHKLYTQAPAVDGAVIREAIRTMDDGERLDIFSEYCRCCGSNDPTCQCWNDE